MNCRAILLSLSLVTLSAFLTPTTAHAQIGVLAGFNSANVDFESEGITINADAKNGFVGGVTFHVASNGFLSFEVDGLLAMKGTKFDFGGGERGTITLTYFDVPLLGRANIPVGGPIRVHVLAGPSFNFKVKETFDPDEGDDEDSGIKSFDTAFVFGGGVNVGRLRVDARWGRSLTSFLDEAEEGLTAKNKVFSLLFGIGF